MPRVTMLAPSPVPTCAVVLCGGRGNRLRPLTDQVPKPMVPVGGRPILEHTVEALWARGLRRFVFPTGWLGRVIEAHVPTLRERFPGEYHCVDTGVSTPIARRLDAIRPLLKEEEHFLLSNGDALFDLDLEPLWEKHRREDAIATLASVEVPARFGLILENGRGVTGFARRAPISGLRIAERGRPVGWIHSGIAWLNQTVFDHFDPAACEDFEADVYPRLIELGRLAHQHLRGPWFCVDTLADLERANERVRRAKKAVV